MKEYGLYLDGRWTAAAGGDTFQTINPPTGEVLAVFAAGDAGDVEKAMQAASKAGPHWRNLPAPKRGEILLAAAMMRKRKDELGSLVSREMGKVISEGRGDVQEAIDFLEYIAGEGRRMFGQTTPSKLPGKFFAGPFTSPSVSSV